jgi:CHASE2 domain-containing sensor protein
VAVVDIDEESIARLGQWPWPRTDSPTERRLGQAGAAVVAYDIVFSEPDRTSPRAIAARYAQMGAARRWARRLPACRATTRFSPRASARCRS